MDWNIEYIAGENYIKVTLEGIFSPHKNHKFFQDLLFFIHWQPGTPLFFDNRHFDFGPVCMNDLRTACDQYQAMSPQLGNGKVALLMKSPLDFGHGRQFEMLSEGKGELQICVFREEEKAVKWLLDKEAACDFFSYSHF